MHMAELRVPRDPLYVGLVRLVVAQAARLAGMSQDRVEDGKIAVAEALAYQAPGGEADRRHPIDLRFGRASAGFEVTVRGLAPPASSDGAVADVGIDRLDPKLSFTLIEGLTDEFSHEQDGDLMQLRFVVGLA
jgi:anti-sigma regulatory factor (Ser/Thr protein kinase)